MTKQLKVFNQPLLSKNYVQSFNEIEYIIKNLGPNDTLFWYTFHNAFNKADIHHLFQYIGNTFDISIQDYNVFPRFNIELAFNLKRFNREVVLGFRTYLEEELYQLLDLIEGINENLETI